MFWNENDLKVTWKRVRKLSLNDSKNVAFHIHLLLRLWKRALCHMHYRPSLARGNYYLLQVWLNSAKLKIETSGAFVVYSNTGINIKLFYFILPWQWSPLLPHGSVKVLPRWRCRNGRQCVEGWTHSERQSRGGKERTGQRGRGAERSANSTYSQVLAFCRRSLIVVVPTCSSHMKHRRWPQRKRLERNLTRHRKKEKRNKQEDSSPIQLNALRHVTPMQVINHKYRKQMHNNIRRKREVFRTEKKTEIKSKTDVQYTQSVTNIDKRMNKQE